MKVIVNVSGFYGGNYLSAGPDEVEMNDKTAKQFLPPRGNQLSLPKTQAKRAALTPPKKDD